MYTEDKQFYIAHCDNGPIYMIGKMANRHGMIAGATVTVKTVILQVLADSLFESGVPFFLADRISRASGSYPGAMIPSDTSLFKIIAVGTSHTSERATKSPNEDILSAPLALA